jgi:hypothetical protein
MTLIKTIERDMALFEKLDDKALDERLTYAIYKLAGRDPERAASYTLQYNIIIQQHSSRVKRQGLQ